MLDLLTSEGFQQAYFSGLLTTLVISAVSAVAAIGIGLLVAYCRMSPLSPLRWAGAVYVELFRNVPLLILLYFFYRGLQGAGLLLAPEVCGVLALSLYTGAYMTEVFRSGLLAIPKEQLDAGLSLGLSRFETYRTILIPQALRVILPPLGNLLISLNKNSSLVALITVPDLFYVIYKGAVDEFRPMEFFIIGALSYALIAWFIVGLIRGVEQLLKASHVHRGGGYAGA
jgi:putative glutamine transport system permease protein